MDIRPLLRALRDDGSRELGAFAQAVVTTVVEWPDREERKDALQFFNIALMEQEGDAGEHVLPGDMAVFSSLAPSNALATHVSFASMLMRCSPAMGEAAVRRLGLPWPLPAAPTAVSTDAIASLFRVIRAAPSGVLAFTNMWRAIAREAQVSAATRAAMHSGPPFKCDLGTLQHFSVLMCALMELPSDEALKTFVLTRVPVKRT